MGEIAESRTAMCLVGSDAEQAEFSHLPPERHGKGIAAVGIVGKRRDSLGSEAAHTRAQRIGLLAEREVNPASNISISSRRPLHDPPSPSRGEPLRSVAAARLSS